MARMVPSLLALVGALCVTSTAYGIAFSIDPSSPSISPTVTAADVLIPGPPGGPPVVGLTRAGMGLMLGDDINALSFGPFQGNEIHFSVDASSTGQAGTAVRSESNAGQQAGDIFSDLFPIQVDHTNTLTRNQDSLGLLPNISAGTANAAPLDNIDALDMDLVSLVDLNSDGTPDQPVYFSLAPGSPTLGIIGATSADILVTTGGGAPIVSVSALTLGLAFGDDIDALLYDPGNVVPLISLTPGSPSVASAADIFAPTIGQGFAGPSLQAGATSSLGLVLNDDVTAFSDRAVLPIPEPATLVLLVLGLPIVLCRRSRRR